MFKATEIDWEKVPEFVRMSEELNAKLLSVYNDPGIAPFNKCAWIADILNNSPV